MQLIALNCEPGNYTYLVSLASYNLEINGKIKLLKKLVTDDQFHPIEISSNFERFDMIYKPYGTTSMKRAASLFFTSLSGLSFISALSGCIIWTDVRRCLAVGSRYFGMIGDQPFKNLPGQVTVDLVEVYLFL